MESLDGLRPPSLSSGPSTAVGWSIVFLLESTILVSLYGERGVERHPTQIMREDRCVPTSFAAMSLADAVTFWLGQSVRRLVGTVRERHVYARLALASRRPSGIF